MSVLGALLLFAIAAVAAIGGAWLIWLATESRMAAALWRPSKQDTLGSSGRAT
jgi:drug/metabolite transporter superfamily protein YnfA